MLLMCTAAVPGKLQFPTAPDLNTRLRRLVAAYQRDHKKRQIKEQKREKVAQISQWWRCDVLSYMSDIFSLHSEIQHPLFVNEEHCILLIPAIPET